MCACDIPVDEKTPNHISSSKLPHVQKYLTSGNCKPWVCACVFSIEKNVGNFWIFRRCRGQKDVPPRSWAGWGPAAVCGSGAHRLPGDKDGGCIKQMRPFQGFGPALFRFFSGQMGRTNRINCNESKAKTLWRQRCSGWHQSQKIMGFYWVFTCSYFTLRWWFETAHIVDFDDQAALPIKEESKTCDRSKLICTNRHNQANQTRQNKVAFIKVTFIKAWYQKT